MSGKDEGANTDKIRLDKFITMAQYSWHNFARELGYYDMADSMHMMCPPREMTANIELGGFILNITPDIPFGSINRENQIEHWHGQIAEIKRLNKPYDFWGIFQGYKLPTGPGYKMLDCQMSKEEYDYMIQQVGDLFLGWEIGEWDGLYGRDIVYYWKPEERPKTRREAHDRFMEYLKDLHEKLYCNTNALCGVTFAHYFNELPVRMLGAEVAQGLLNNQVYISFLRGACKQYDMQYKILSSIFDRWGYRCYTESPDVTLENETGIGVWKGGPHYGHSVGLLQAIWVTSYFAEASIVGLDGSFYTDELVNGVRQLSPLGKAFSDFTKWAHHPCPRGRQVRPVALMLDYYAGWTPPRHLYSFEERVVWHSIPYGPSDHGMDQAYEMFYPGYCKSGYYRDERGFITTTPMGDTVDVLLSDASTEAMGAYPIIWLLSDEVPGKDFEERLKVYVKNGGHLVISGRPMLEIGREWFGMQIVEEKKPAVLSVISETGEEVREVYFSVHCLKSEEPWCIYAHTEKGNPLIMYRTYGNGRITFITADHGLTDNMTAPGFDMNRNLDYRPEPLFEILHSVQRYVKGLLEDNLPVQVDRYGVYYAINDLGDSRYVICLYNPGVEIWTGSVKLKAGKGILKEVNGPWRNGTSLNGTIITLKGNETAVFTLG